MARLYPPYIEGKLPAQVSVELKIPFEDNRGVSKSDITGISAVIKTVSTSTTIGTYNGRIQDNVAIFNCNNDLTIGQFYKIQLAYISSNSVGYYSTVGIFKYTAMPTIEVLGLDEKGISQNLQKYQGSFTPNALDEQEKEYSYSFSIYQNDDLVYTTGELIHNFETDLDILDTSGILQDDTIYTLQYCVNTINNLQLMKEYVIVNNSLLEVPTVFNGKLIAVLDRENARVSIGLASFNSPYGMHQGEYRLLRRKDDLCEELGSFIINGTISQCESHPTIIFQDTTVTHGCEYQYILQQFHGSVVGQKLYSNNVVVDFEDMFLSDGQRQLKLRFNPKVSSFKTTILESKTDTLGSKYPFFFRNGNTAYKDFAISALISMLGDENELFAEWQIDSFDSNTDLLASNISRERVFKMQVLEWLNNGQPKLFRSPAEGNYIVRLMNVTMSPTDSLGRMLHTFNAQAYEIAEHSLTNLLDFQLISKISDIRTFSVEQKILTDTDAILENIETSYLKLRGFLREKVKLTFKDGTSQLIGLGKTGVYELQNMTDNPIIKVQKLNGDDVHVEYENTSNSDFPLQFKNTSVARVASHDTMAQVFNIDDNNILTQFYPVEKVDEYTQSCILKNNIFIPKFEDIDNSAFQSAFQSCFDTWEKAGQEQKVKYESLSVNEQRDGMTSVNPMIYQLRDNKQFINSYRDIYKEMCDIRDDENITDKSGKVNCITLCNMLVMGIPYNYSRLNCPINMIGTAGYCFDICQLLNTNTVIDLDGGCSVSYNPFISLNSNNFHKILTQEAVFGNETYKKLGLIRTVRVKESAIVDNSIWCDEIRPGDILWNGTHSMFCLKVETSNGQTTITYGEASEERAISEGAFTIANDEEQDKIIKVARPYYMTTSMAGLLNVPQEQSNMAVLHVPKFEDIDNTPFQNALIACAKTWEDAAINEELEYASLKTDNAKMTNKNPMLYSSVIEVINDEDADEDEDLKPQIIFSKFYRDIKNSEKVNSVNCITFCNMLIMGVNYESSRLFSDENDIGGAGYAFDICKLLDNDKVIPSPSGGFDVTYNLSDSLNITNYQQILTQDAAFGNDENGVYGRLGLVKTIRANKDDDSSNGIWYNDIRPGDLLWIDEGHCVLCIGVKNDKNWIELEYIHAATPKNFAHAHIRQSSILAYNDGKLIFQNETGAGYSTISKVVRPYLSWVNNFSYQIEHKISNYNIKLLHFFARDEQLNDQEDKSRYDIVIEYEDGSVNALNLMGINFTSQTNPIQGQTCGEILLSQNMFKDKIFRPCAIEIGNGVGANIYYTGIQYLDDGGVTIV